MGGGGGFRGLQFNRRRSSRDQDEFNSLPRYRATTPRHLSIMSLHSSYSVTRGGSSLLKWGGAKIESMDGEGVKSRVETVLLCKLIVKCFVWQTVWREDDAMGMGRTRCDSRFVLSLSFVHLMAPFVFLSRFCLSPSTTTRTLFPPEHFLILSSFRCAVKLTSFVGGGRPEWHRTNLEHRRPVPSRPPWAGFKWRSVAGGRCLSVHLK